jgi:hypothetical protein
MDNAAHKAISWEVPKDYDIHRGIALEIADPVGDASHEIRCWEITRELPPIATANELYDWLATRLIERNPARVLLSGDDMEVHAQRKGDGAFILFVSQDNLVVDMDSAPVICKVEYYEGYATFGMPEAYTMKMLFAEFRTLTDGWQLLPSLCYGRDVQGWVIRETLTNWKLDEDPMDDDRILCLPPRIQEGAACGTEINLRSDQL